MAAHKLTYFPLAGRAFPIRVCMKASGLPFEDVRLPGPEYREKKATMDLPLGQMPVLLIGDKTFCQSTALARYAAKKAGLYPKGGFLTGDLATRPFVRNATLLRLESLRQQMPAPANA